MGGASGYLWQEFKEVELLNEVTKMRYLDVHVPDVLHSAFRWSQIIPQSRYREQVIDHSFIPAKVTFKIPDEVETKV
jgi:hypothetical protein